MEELGRLDQVVRDGWVMDDSGDGGLQFDNGVAGVAVLKLYQATHDRRYLDSVLRSADWAAARPMAPNWNYNSFQRPPAGLCLCGDARGEVPAAAKKKALMGVIPGQLTSGPHAGRWLDAHNARPAYHYIMMRALAALATVLPASDADRAPSWARSDWVLRLAIQILSSAARRARTAPWRPWRSAPGIRQRSGILARNQSDRALSQLGKLVSAEYRRGGMPVGPGAWGMYLTLIGALPR